MADPARLENIEPDIDPALDLHAIEGGGESTPDRASLHAVNEAESNLKNPDTDTPINDQEAAGSNVVNGPWKNKVDSPTSSKDEGKLKGFVKKKGASIGIIMTLVGLTGTAMFITPGLLIVNIKEVMTNKFNAQLASMDVRSTKLLTKKMETTKGICNKVASVKCRYGTMSEKQIKKFREAGIHVNYDLGETSLLGRRKPTSFQLIEGDGKTLGNEIPPNMLMSEMKNNSKLRTAITRAYNPKYMGYVGKVFKKVQTKLGVSKKSALSGKDDAARDKEVIEKTKKGFDAGDESLGPVKKDDKKPDGTKYTDAEIEAENARRTKINDMSKGVKEGKSGVLKSGIKSATSTLKRLGTSLKITGYLDTVCTAYKTVKTVGYAAKTIRALQLARYAMLFLNVADQIKAGEAKAEDVAYLGKILTTEIVSTNILENGSKNSDKNSRKSATDSFGYKYAAYGKGGTMSETATKYLTGGGVVGLAIKLSSKFSNALGGSPKKICGVLSNPFVSTVSTGAGLIAGIFSGGSSMLISAIEGEVIGRVTSYLQGLLTDIVAGVLVDKDTVGEEAGNALTAGASGMMGTTANMGGNAPLKPDQAVAYTNLTNDVLARYAEEERLAYSPLDISNSNTFMGMIVSKLVPYTSKMSSLSGTISSIASITTNSFNLVAPPVTKAAETDVKADDYRRCDDDDYRDLDVATDPFCNVSYGLTSESLNIDPVDASDWLVDNGHIDEDTGEAKSDEYTNFIKNCINRDSPLGDDTGSNGTGEECFVDSSPNNKYFYAHFVDQRVQAGMDGEEDEESSSSNSGNGSIICVDAGHPPEGAPGEPVLNLKVAQDLQKELEGRGYKVIMTRTDSSDVSLAARSKTCLDGKAGFMYSLHADDSPRSAGFPYQIYMKKDRKLSATSKSYAEIIQKAVAAQVAGVGELKDGGIGEEGAVTAVKSLGIFTGADKGNMPAVLTEAVHLNNGSSALDDASTRAKLVKGIADGIQNIFSKNSTGNSQVSAS
jgi:N-acetylmuramoyl-L-alanine amidase